MTPSDFLPLTGIRVDVVPDTTAPKGTNKVVVADPKAPPLWARFYDLERNQPMYVSRDGTVHETYNEIDRERRLGYSYLGPYAGGLLKRDYPKWKKRLEVDAGN